jgi:hypothetical protein
MSTAFRNLLEAGDVAGCRKFWAEKFPNMPQPKTQQEAEVTMHRARTEANSVSLRARAYSHAWLIERGMESGLPDDLKPKAQQIHPVRAVAVGISVNFRSDWMRDAAVQVRGAMEGAVLDAHAHGKIEDTPFVRARMFEARDREMRSLFGKR